MNPAFWIIIFLLAGGVWLIATTSMFSNKVGGFVKDIHEAIEDSFEEGEDDV